MGVGGGGNLFIYLDQVLIIKGGWGREFKDWQSPDFSSSGQFGIFFVAHSFFKKIDFHTLVTETRECYLPWSTWIDFCPRLDNVCIQQAK